MMGSSRGKWSRPGVPQKGWKCVDIEDLGAPDAICEMCESQEIRYVHYMEHPNYNGVLGVGCVCAEHLEEDYQAPRQRERALRNVGQRRSRWLARAWKVSAKGNSYLNTDGFNIVIFRNANGTWGGRINDRVTDQSNFLRKKYKTESDAKLAAFDAMIFLKKEKGWGT